MSGFDVGSVSSENFGLIPNGDNEIIQSGRMEPYQIQSMFRQFIREFRNEHQQFAYRASLKMNYDQGDYFLEVDLDDVRAFHSELLDKLVSQPKDNVPIFERAAAYVYEELTVPKPQKVERIQIFLKNYPRYTELRRMGASEVSSLVAIKGIVISASKPSIKAVEVTIECKNCHSTDRLQVSAGFGGVSIPRTCSNTNRLDNEKCGLDPYQVDPDASLYDDTQRLKLQEAPETVPTGEMPRQVIVYLDGYLVGKVKPGSRVTVIGIHTTYQPKGGGKDAKGVGDVSICIPYVKALGIENEANDGDGLISGKFNPDDLEEMHNLHDSHENFYEALSSSIAPAIMGRDDIKKAIACCLFGGARKHLPDGARLRGDINVLLLGDPSVAKSQFLKFAAQTAPISVYTSGKGSSAAGLTASVMKDPATGEFHLEGGAMVLADGGLVCIDEFDKMREQDRVAIHEAMEQQTISIAKAGITTILNSRTGVLAAANPAFGRYDDMKSATENIMFQATILSRFDLIFIIKDVQDARMDGNLAAHIINVHKKVDVAVMENNANLIDINKLKKYIAYARSLDVRLSDEAGEVLKNSYVSIRHDMMKRRSESGDSAAQAIPITVRQLEAVIRLSESLARMDLQLYANVDHVKEALRLFKVATLQAASAPFSDSAGNPEFDKKTKAAEQWFLVRVSQGSELPTKQLLRDAVAMGHDENASRKALHNLVLRNTFSFLQQRRVVRRIGQ